MLVEQLEGSQLLVDADELLCAFAAAALALFCALSWRGRRVRGRGRVPAGQGGVQSVLGLAVRWRRHAGQRGSVSGSLGEDLQGGSRPLLLQCESFTTAMMLAMHGKWCGP